MAEAHRRTLDQLSSGVAVFDAERRLAFYNDSYRRLWDLDRAFLDGNPDDSSVLDRLRAARKLPEQPDFRAWKTKLHEAYRAVEAAQGHLVSAGRPRAAASSPRPIRKAASPICSTTSPKASIWRGRFDGLIRVQRETLDNLAEARRGVRQQRPRAAVQSGLRADVEAVARTRWREQPHIETVESWCRPLFDDDATWQTLRAAITGIDNRISVPLKLERKDGSVLDCMTMPLPDGATMLTFQDVTDTVNVERALRERNEALETADQMKIDFVHHVSYELRSPLTTIIGFAHFLSDPVDRAADAEAERVSRLHHHLDQRAARDHQQHPRSRHDRRRRDEARISGRSTCARPSRRRPKASRTVWPASTSRSMSRSSPRSAASSADERRIVQVLYNLLANAVGFSPHERAVTLRARRTSAAWCSRCPTRGPGIPPRSRTRCSTGSRAIANGSRHRGAGLGLSLVRSFVELHGGKVRVDSIVGQGHHRDLRLPGRPDAHRNAAE